MMRNAVSEVLGYIYIFGIVMTVLAIVFIQVNSMVEDMKRSVLSQSLEKSFKRIQYLVYSVAFGDAPMQVAELELQGGWIFLKQGEPEFIIAFVNESQLESCNPLPQSFSLKCLNLSTGDIKDVSLCNGIFDAYACVFSRNAGVLRYEYKDWVLSMESGAVFSKYSSQEYSKLLYEPRILLNTTAANSRFLVITIPVLYSNESFSAAGSGRFRFLLSEAEWEHAMIEGVNLDKGISWNNFTDCYVIVRGSENQRAWCDFFDSFPLLNVSLKDKNCMGFEYCSCYRAEEPMARVETEGFATTFVILFKNVTLKKV
jgi:hypothetical protein